MIQRIKHFPLLLRIEGKKNFILNLFDKNKQRMIIHENSFFNIHTSSKIQVYSKFNINKKWVKNDPNKSFIVLKNKATLVVDKFDIYSGANISVNENAFLKLGSGYINYNVNIACFEKIEIGYDVAISENVVIRDSDNHQIVSSNHQMTSPIKIEDHVWIGTNVIILKGVTVGEGSIIAAGSVVTKDIPKNSLAAGIPARVIKSNVEWK
ncbi:acyltransferase [Faecalibacter macacae]|uniref:Acyltransferase n=1 Tax=Faecalibacter macacae TaxID=1859289 RepID=A0A3L9MIA1_9FLAO|nr:acyltransferase [Faecalibacter macacae]RLZ12793.1 acyltransferase [Faecalibacter macacae]